MLHLNDGYLLHELAGIPYILPYGQNIADFKRSIRLNEAGAALFRALQEGAGEAELPSVLMSHYGAGEADAAVLEEDVRLFLFQLETAGIVTRREDPEPGNPRFRIGPVTISYSGPEELLWPSFSRFPCGRGEPDIALFAIPSRPVSHPVGEMLIRTNELAICRGKDAFLFLYPEGYGVTEAHVSPDGRRAAFYCPKPFAPDLPEKLFHAIRFAFLIRAQQMGVFALHSASILYEGKAWLFSGPSGTGKSTHAAIWNRLYETPVLNGDLNLIGLSGGSPVVYGNPWCGTSGIFTEKTYPLGGVVFLKQAPEDAALPMTPDETCSRALQRLVSPSWTEGQLRCCLSFVEKLSRAVPFFHLACTAKDSAAALIKQEIDRTGAI